jgi:hypothetical protein
MNDIDSLARRLAGRIWNTLPEEGRTADALLAETLRHASHAAANFTPRTNPYAHMRETYPNAGKPWKRTDDEEMRRLFEAGNSIDDLMLLFGRSRNGVEQRLIFLGALPEKAVA